jgi:dihydrofolate reductase
LGETYQLDSGDTAAEVAKLGQGYDGHIVVYGGLTLWQSLMRLDLIDTST